jgi:hypothetical protein
MKKALHLIFLFNLGLLCLLSATKTYSQSPTYSCDIRNEVLVASNIFEFDLYLTRSGSIPLELAGFNTGILLNTGFVNGGTITPSLLPGSELNASQVPTNIAYDAAYRCVKIAPKKPPRDYDDRLTSGTVINNTTGTKVCRVQLINSVNFGADPFNYTWSMDLMPYHTVVAAFVPGAFPLVNAIITNATSQSKSDNLTLFLEGLYEEGTGNSKAQDETGDHFAGSVADVISVEFAQDAAPHSAVYTVDNVQLYANGKCSLSVPGALNGSYYIVVKHRNSIETWSALPVSLAGGAISYNFSNAASQAYGDNMKLMGSVYAIYSADPNQDGTVDGSDMLLIDNASKPPVLHGYNPEDLNGDGSVDGTDMLMVDNNSKPPVVGIVKP